MNVLMIIALILMMVTMCSTDNSTKNTIPIDIENKMERKVVWFDGKEVIFIYDGKNYTCFEKKGVNFNCIKK
jgi:hypothetical protein